MATVKRAWIHTELLKYVCMDGQQEEGDCAPIDSWQTYSLPAETSGPYMAHSSSSPKIKSQHLRRSITPASSFGAAFHMARTLSSLKRRIGCTHLAQGIEVVEISKSYLASPAFVPLWHKPMVKSRYPAPRKKVKCRTYA